MLFTWSTEPKRLQVALQLIYADNPQQLKYADLLGPFKLQLSQPSREHNWLEDSGICSPKKSRISC